MLMTNHKKTQSSFFSCFLGNGKVDASILIRHPDFDVTKLKNKDIHEFYDYDVALIKVSSKIELSAKAR